MTDAAKSWDELSHDEQQAIMTANPKWYSTHRPDQPAPVKKLQLLSDVARTEIHGISTGEVAVLIKHYASQLSGGVNDKSAAYNTSRIIQLTGWYKDQLE